MSDAAGGRGIGCQIGRTSPWGCFTGQGVAQSFFVGNVSSSASSSGCSSEHYLLTLVPVTAGCFHIAKCAHSMSRKLRNRRMHALNGNAAGSRKSERKRNQKGVSKFSDDLAGIYVKQLGDLLKLLLQLLNLLGSGSGGGNTLQQLLSLGMSAVQESHGTVSPKKKKKTQKPKNKQGGGGGAENSQGTQIKTTSNQRAGNPKNNAGTGEQQKAEALKAKQSKPTFAEVVASKPSGFVPVWQLRSSDWDGSVFSFEGFVDALEKEGDVRAVVQVDSDEQLGELRVLLEAESGKARQVHVTAVMLAPRDAKPMTGRELRVVPGKVSGKVQPRQAFLMPIVGKGPSLKRPAVVASNAVASDTVVVRVSVDAKYLQQSEWQSIQSKPRAAVQNWLSKTMPATLANAVFDMWGFQEEATKGGGRPIITGLLRIEKSSSKAFVEPLRWDESVIASCDVEWVKKLQHEDGPTYMKRVQGLSGDLGLARGFNSLGIRKPRAASEKLVKSRTWRITGSPRDWGAQTLTSELLHAGIENVKVLSRKSWGSQVEWWIEGVASSDTDFLEITAGNQVLVVVAALPPKPKRQKVKKLASGGRVLFQDASKQDGLSAPATTQQLRSFYIGSPIKTKEVEPTLKDTPSSPQGGAMEEDSRQEKRMGSTPGKDRPAKRAAVVASPPFGLKPRANAGQGNCVFEALGQGLDHKQPKAARGVRAAIVNHLRRHDARYKPWWDGREPTNEEAPCDSWDKYLTLLAKVGSWGGSLELAAAAVHYDRPVLVFRAQGVPEVYNAQGRAGEAILLWFHNKHYESLEGELPQGILQQTAAGPMQGGRGGGECSDLVSEAHTRCSALPSEMASGKTRVAAMPACLVSTRNAATNSSAKPLPGSSSSEQRGNAHVTSASVGWGAAEECSSVAFDDHLDLDSDIGDKQKVAVLENETKKRKLGHPKLQEWNCPKCDFSTGKTKLWPQKKSAHIRAWHPEDRKAFNIPQGRLRTLAVPKSGEKVLWQCPHCDWPSLRIQLQIVTKDIR